MSGGRTVLALVQGSGALARLTEAIFAVSEAIRL
jgi:hypothetical protein